MSNTQYFLYLLVVAGSTYLIRSIPFVLAKEKITNRFIRSFLHYIPFAVLTAMTIPAVFFATGSIVSALCGVICAVILAYMGKGLTTVALASSLVVFIVQTFVH